ncbi:MAG: asparagine synthase (glutamine-hydrolyzing) [Cyanobacteria bacterium P01_F01_bin.56]
MCGLAGFNGTFSKSLLLEMNDLISHRGPDNQDIYYNQTSAVGLAHSRLSILDLSPAGNQPMWDSLKTICIVFNGEIYNFLELRNELIRDSYQFKGGSDTEVIINLYLKYGQSFIERLNGIFALAIWDSRSQSLLLARDALGVKPLYYSFMEAGVAFASEIKALLPLLSDSCEQADNPFQNFDAAAIDRYLSFLWCPGTNTPTQNVRSLGPGEGIWLKKGEIIDKFTWYQLPVLRSHHSARSTSYQSSTSMNADAAVHGTERHLRQAVHRQMVADVPVGAFLSGGLDSSSIVTFAREHQPKLQCFTIEVTGAKEGGIADDLPYARRVAEHLKVPLNVVQIDAARMAADLPAMVAQLDEPLADPAPLNVLYICRLAREQGIKVLLSGAGGDDLFTGYRRHRALMAEPYWAWLPKSVRTQLAHWSRGLDQRQLLGRRLRKLFSGAALEGDNRLVNYFRWIDRQDLTALYTQDFKDALAHSWAEAPILDFLAELPPTTHPLERLLALEQRFFLTDHNLIYTDKMSMAVGVEVRVPFLDLELVEFAAHIPPQYKQRGRQSKWVLKQAMEPYLPRDIIYRPKSGFGAPLRRWMRHELRELLADVLSEQSLNNRGIFDPQAVQQLIQANDNGKLDASYTLLSLMCIELWCRQFIDQVEVIQ